MKIYRLLLLLPLLLIACKKEGDNSPKPSNFEDLPFEIGQYDSYDYHVVYDPPKRVVNLEWDLDQDGEKDLYFGGYNQQLGGYGNEWGLELRSLGAQEWRIRSTDFKDSIFFCGSSPDPYDGFVYNRHSILREPCRSAIDSFVEVKSICSRPQQFAFAAPWPQAQENGNKQAFYDFTYALLSPPTYFVFNGSEVDTLSHYLLLEKQLDTTIQKAWIKVQRKILRRAGQVLVYVEELAVQKEGRD